MIDTLLLKTFTPLHYTCQHFTSSHLNFTQLGLLHFTTLSFGFTPFKFPTIPFHLTSLLLNDFCHTSILSLHPFIIAFLTPFLKILGLQRKVPNTSAGSWFQFFTVLFTKEYFLISILCFLSLIFWTCQSYSNSTASGTCCLYLSTPVSQSESFIWLVNWAAFICIWSNPFVCPSLHGSQHAAPYSRITYQWYVH